MMEYTDFRDVKITETGTLETVQNLSTLDPFSNKESCDMLHDKVYNCKLFVNNKIVYIISYLNLQKFLLQLSDLIKYKYHTLILIINV